MELEFATIEDIAKELASRPNERDYVMIYRDENGNLDITAKPKLKLRSVCWMLSYYTTHMLAFLSTDKD